MSRAEPITPGPGQCALCGASVPAQALICGGCQARTADALLAYWHRAPTPFGRAPNLLDELTTSLTRQSRMALASDGARSTERPLPYDTRVADVHADDTRWLIAAAEKAGAPKLIVRMKNPAVCARWLWSRIDTLMRSNDAPVIAEEALYRHRRAYAVIDRPPEAWFAGRCRCGADLYAADRASVIECRSCFAIYDVAEQRAKLLAGVEDMLATATEICRAVGLLDKPVTRSQLDNWHARGQLARRGRSPAGHHLYRVGDVLDLLARRT